MTRRATKDFSRQIAQVRNYEILPSDRYEMTEFKVVEWPHGYVCVSRKYRPIGMKIEYSQCYRVGPRGGVKVIYSEIYN